MLLDTGHREDRILDLRGLTCPMPALKTKKAVVSMEPGQTLKVLATDRATLTDIPALLKRLDAEILQVEEKDNTITFLIRRT